MNDASVVKTIVDICSRSFKIVSDEGYIQLVQCESAQEFMDVLEVVNEFLDEDMLVFSEIITKPKRNRKIRKRKKEETEYVGPKDKSLGKHIYKDENSRWNKEEAVSYIKRYSRENNKVKLNTQE